MRLGKGGRIDRDVPVAFRFDGRAMRGFSGDTLASALIAAGVRVAGRSFKYHRPRGILTAGSEEPNALVTTGTGARAIPNQRATVLELHDGLVARSQNAWPSLGFDLLAASDLAAPFFGAGFYYKTFMWPPKFWERIYEPMIRRAAGLGALPGRADNAWRVRAFAFCDVLVIGAGPAGLMAAWTAAEAGADVILADEDTRPGGRLNAETGEVDGQPGAEWAAGVAARLEAMPNVRVMRRTVVTGAYDQGTFAALERAAPGSDAPIETFWRIVAGRAVLAAGALERHVAFAGNDRPGVMMAGAVRAYVNRWAVSPGRAIAVFGNNDDAHRTARDLIAAGVHVAAMIDSRADPPEGQGYEVIAGAQVCGTAGRSGLERVRIRQGGREFWLAADCLAMSGGWNPSVHLSCHLNGRPVWREDIAAFVPAPDAVPDMVPAGACNGEMSTRGCLSAGRAAGRAAADALGFAGSLPDLPRTQADPARITALWAVPGKGRAWLDFQNDVTTKDVRQAARENFRSVEHMKRYTTQGMATDQGKGSNVTALAVLADATGRTISQTGTTTFRPPYHPVSIAAMGAGAQGQGFAPRRLTTSHATSIAAGAPMIEAGLWYRPSYFPQAGERSWRDSCDREVAMVRTSVGICDVTTLGKIDVQGPGAADLLDFVYANSFGTLGQGRVRYGLMLREDGHVMDDGTVARLGPQHFVITTTTAAAGQVMRHLEWVRQALRPELDVALISVTEQWAQFAVAGPRARDLMADVTGETLRDKEWPFMSCGPVTVAGVAGRLFRISFSGERGYEVAVPARYGAALFERLLRGAGALGGGAYGMEALNVLRIEKGFITHAEIDGRVTAGDLGMGRMVSTKKDCIGKDMAARPGLNAADRRALVGLRPVENGGTISAGGHLFVQTAEAVRVNSQGHVTSVAHSPTLGGMIGLGFLERGPARHGEVVRLVDHLRGIETLCEVTSPVFFDPEGERVRG